jgi:outer membrane receptor protein involved in Fe transport
VALATLSHDVAAQPDTPDEPAVIAEVVGRIVDGATGKPVRRAAIQIENTDITIRADNDGRFVITDVPRGANLIVSADGYEPAIITAAAALPDIALLREGATSEVIEVSGEAPPPAPGATSLDRDEIAHVPGTGNDLIASLDVLPGVTSTFAPISFSGVIIRGSAPEDSKFLVDGFEVPFIYHAVGFRSIMPTEAIAGLDYLPGGFDVSQGRASSGIVGITTRAGERDLGGSAELSIIDGGLLAHGPAGDKGSYLVALRRSTIDLILPSLIPDDTDLALTTVPRYWDGQARVDFELSHRWRLAFKAIGSDDALELFADDDEDPDLRFFSRIRFLRLIAEAKWRRDTWSASVALSSMVTELDFEFGRMQYFAGDFLSNTVRTEVERNLASWIGLKDPVTRFGGEVVIGRAGLDLALPPRPDEGEPMVGPPDDDDITERFEGVVWVPDVAAWVSQAGGLGDNARLTAGVRVDGFLRGGDVAVQPRGELAIKLPRGVTTRLAAGAYRRPPEYQDENLDDTLDPERATQVVLGAEFSPLAGLKLQLSTYYTDRTHLLTRAVDGGYENVGRGETVGGELLAVLRRGDLFAWMSYSLSHSTRVDRPGEPERLFDFDQPHDLNLAATWKRGKWQFGGRFRLASGQPYTPVIGSVYESDSDYYIPVFGDLNSLRVPPHHQIDLRVDRTWIAGPVKLTAFLDVQNVYLKRTVVGYGYSFDYSERFAFETLPILPSIGLRGEL